MSATAGVTTTGRRPPRHRRRRPRTRRRGAGASGCPAPTPGRVGAWRWQAGHYEKRHKGQRFTAGRWQQVGDHFEWTAGGWGQAPAQQDAPPALYEEPVQHRRGFTWVKGHWQWLDGSYRLVPGHLERRARGKRWVDGQSGQAGGNWTWTAGTWADAPAQPIAPPPAAPIEKVRPRRGYVWVKGAYQWNAGDYEWVAGHWERQRAAKVWVDGRWDQANGQWTWSAGVWQ